MYDILISAGTVVDGTNAPAFVADVGISEGRIVAVGRDIGRDARQHIDADGALVTPGWVDVHTHYDGQATWDDAMAPSSMNGTTTVIMGNCGVGFAPVAPGTEQTLIELMEGVEDIPGAALVEGIPWGAWETFGEYLDHLQGRTYALDVGTQIPHGALRFYVMGERGVEGDATAADRQRQGELVAEAIDAGALGFTTSRTIGHRSLWGEPVPGTFAAHEELFAIADAMAALGKGVMEAIPASTIGPLDHLGGERSTLLEEVAMLSEFSKRSGRPVTFTLVSSSANPSEWQSILSYVDTANQDGASLYPQVPSRPVSVLTGLSSYHAFMRKPTYLEHLAHLPLDQRVREMRKPDVRTRLLSEQSVVPDAPGSMDNLYGFLTLTASKLIPLHNPVDYLQPQTPALGDQAIEEGRDVMEVVYDFLLLDNGSRFARVSAAEAADTRTIIREMLTHDATVSGLSDAGAHVTMICDGTMPTTALCDWARDLPTDEQIPLETVVHMHSMRNAELYGMVDRGSIAPGKRADINLIDLDNLQVAPPDPINDLPAGGTRLIQPVQGYVATICDGSVTRRFDEDTGERPGRLVRS